MDLFSLKGKTVVLTGGCGNLGRIMAGYLLEYGATLMIAGNIPGKTQTLALAIYDAFQAGNDEQATVLVVLTSCLCLTILVLADRLFGGKAGGR